MKDKKKVHPDYGLRDQARGRCPYCLTSADMDCDCEEEEGGRRMNGWYRYVEHGWMIIALLAFVGGAYATEARYHWKTDEYLSPRHCANIVCETHNFMHSGTIGTDKGDWSDLAIIYCYNETWCPECGWDGEGLWVFDNESVTKIRYEISEGGGR